jgi:outer membrane protein assembly factor BamB
LIYASGVLAEGRIYYPSREKGTYVVAAKPVFELLARNIIESDTSVFNGTPAVSHSQLFLRSDKYLYCIGKR